MSNSYDFDVLIIGAGPGGYVAAIRAGQLGLKTAVVERDKPGGVCLNWGCIPSKALISQGGIYSRIKDLESMGVKVDLSGFDYGKVYKKSRKAAETLSRGVQFLLKKNSIHYITGNGRIEDPHRVRVDGDKTYSAKFIIIATGARPAEIPGFKTDEEQVLSSTGALSLKKLPESMIILGSGAVGMEFAHIFNTFGVDVTVVEMLPGILPTEDREIASVVERAFKKRKIKIHTGTKALSMSREEGLLSVEVQKGEEKETLKGEMILVAVGRTPNTEDIGLDKAGITAEKGFIPVGDYGRTSVPSIYAIGDVVATPLLAHVASKEGEIAVEHMAGHNPPPRPDPMAIPGAVYCEPQVGSFGLNEETAKDKGIKYGKATFPYRGAGKAVAVEEPDGMVKILFDPDTHEILGGHVVGAEATELIHEILLARSSELLPEDIATMIHAHPTLSEAVMEAARAVEGWAIHI